MDDKELIVDFGKRLIDLDNRFNVLFADIVEQMMYCTLQGHTELEQRVDNMIVECMRLLSVPLFNNDMTANIRDVKNDLEMKLNTLELYLADIQRPIVTEPIMLVDNNDAEEKSSFNNSVEVRNHIQQIVNDLKK